MILKMNEYKWEEITLLLFEWGEWMLREKKKSNRDRKNNFQVKKKNGRRDNLLKTWNNIFFFIYRLYILLYHNNIKLIQHSPSYIQ